MYCLRTLLMIEAGSSSKDREHSRCTEVWWLLAGMSITLPYSMFSIVEQIIY
jgi:hypothetical protein